MQTDLPSLWLEIRVNPCNGARRLTVTLDHYFFRPDILSQLNETRVTKRIQSAGLFRLGAPRREPRRLAANADDCDNEDV